MKISIETSPYNDRRYGKPWIAAVDFTVPKGNFTFGDFIGSYGSNGLLEIDAKEGDIIAKGQKDNRGQAYKSAPSFYQVQADGSLGDELTKPQAVKAWRALHAAPPVNPLAGFTDAEIVAEYNRRNA